ncbi:MAG: ABC transporter ATP-binding protein, partial [Thermoflexus sp.]
MSRRSTSPPPSTPTTGWTSPTPSTGSSPPSAVTPARSEISL